MKKEKVKKEKAIKEKAIKEKPVKMKKTGQAKEKHIKEARAKNKKHRKKYVGDGVLDHKIKEASFSRSRNMPLPEPETDILYRWQKEPRPKKGYYIVKDTYFEGINKATGFPYRHYEMIRIRRTEDEDRTVHGSKLSGTNRKKTESASLW